MLSEIVFWLIVVVPVTLLPVIAEPEPAGLKVSPLTELSLARATVSR